MHEDGGIHLRLCDDLLSEGKPSLLAVDSAHGQTKLSLRESLKAFKVFASLRGFSLAAICLGQSEFGGDVKRIYRQHFLKGSDRLVVALKLRVKIAEKIERVWIVPN